MNIFTFDIETIPDIENGRKILGLENLSDQEVVQAMLTLRRQENLSDFLPHHLQKIIAISAVLSTENRIKVWSLGTPESSEPELIERFFNGLDHFTPTLVTWNGGGFDLPVLHYRSLLYGISAPRYWEIGDGDPNFRWNNYLNRFHYRHMDLMDILAAYQSRANAPLDQIAIMLGLPGKMGMNGKKIWQHYFEGRIEDIRNYCETDALNTYLIYLRFELLRGRFDKSQYLNQCQRLRDYLLQEPKPHLHTFVENWQTPNFATDSYILTPILKDQL